MAPQPRSPAGRPNGLLRGRSFSNTAGALFALDALLSAPAWMLAAAWLETGAQAPERRGFEVNALAAFGCWLLFLLILIPIITGSFVI